MSLDFDKYVAKGVIGDLSAIALYMRIMRMSTLCGYLVQRRDLVQG